MNTNCTIAMLGLVAVLGAPAAAENKLLLPGRFHGEEVSAKSGQHWLALFQNGESGMLTEQALKVSPVKDELVDEGSANTGVSVSVARTPAPLFMVKGIPGLVPGKVRCVNITPLSELRKRRKLLLRFNNRTYQISLQIRTRTDPQTKDPLESYKLSLSDGKLTQTIADVRDCNLIPGPDCPPTILWAGDLDHDGRLDLLVNIANDYNASAPTLFLSRRAGHGKLVRRAADFTTSGC
jgi:hypothetical protein